MTVLNSNRQGGFTLFELVIVVVIIGIVSAVAIPRLSRGSRTAGAAAAKSNAALLKHAIEIYAAEHDGKYPGADIEKQLTEYSNFTGDKTNPEKDPGAGVVYGPYLNKMPPLKLSAADGVPDMFVAALPTDTPPANPASDGWWYNPATREIKIVLRSVRKAALTAETKDYLDKAGLMDP